MKATTTKTVAGRKLTAAQRRAKSSWANGPLAKWARSRRRMATHRDRARASWAEGGALREAHEEMQAEALAAASA